MRIKLAEVKKAEEYLACFGEDVRVYRNTEIRYLTTDTRELLTGDMFVALPGAKENGTRYLRRAEECGAAAAIEGNGLLHLKEWATSYKNRVSPKTIAITGSVGKSSVKELLRSLLSECFTVHATESNYNTEIGLLLTILSMPEDCNLLIAEMGARASGDIRILSELAQPDIGIITAIGHAHVGCFGSVEEIRKAKLEITEGMKDGGKLFLGVGVEVPTSLPPSIRIVRLSDSGNAPYTVRDIRAEASTTRFSLKTEKTIYEDLCVTALGTHIAHNAGLGVAVVEEMGLTEEKIRCGLLHFKPLPLRAEIRKRSGVTVIEDYYNASPESMRAAASLLCLLENAPETKKSYALLGDMLELGEYGSALHKEIGSLFGRLPIDGIFAFGAEAHTLLDAAREVGFTGILSDTPDDLKRLLKSGDVLLIKASRDMHAEKWLKRLFTTGGDDEV